MSVNLYNKNNNRKIFDKNVNNTAKYLRTVVYSLLSLNIAILLTSILCIPKLFKFSVLFLLLYIIYIIIIYLYTNNRKLLKIFVIYVIILALELPLASIISAISICIIISIPPALSYSSVSVLEALNIDLHLLHFITCTILKDDLLPRLSSSEAFKRFNRL